RLPAYHRVPHRYHVGDADPDTHVEAFVPTLRHRRVAFRHRVSLEPVCRVSDASCRNQYICSGKPVQHECTQSSQGLYSILPDNNISSEFGGDIPGNIDLASSCGIEIGER